ncbi:MAG: MarR family transcriptional regulator [Peptococcaceae bacterium]|nr:MarR family transcriptional regulator [Peptococcaceae bacterium]
MMDTLLTRAFMDACHKAKRIIKYLPPLPEWMTPRQVKVIDAIHQLAQQQDAVRISDVANHLEGTMPSITRMIATLEEHGAVEKRSDATDKRIQTLVLTPYGEDLYDYYIERFHNHVAEVFSGIDEEDMRTAIAIIDQTEHILRQTLGTSTFQQK